MKSLTPAPSAWYDARMTYTELLARFNSLPVKARASATGHTFRYELFRMASPEGAAIALERLEAKVAEGVFA